MLDIPKVQDEIIYFSEISSFAQLACYTSKYAAEEVEEKE